MTRTLPRSSVRIEMRPIPLGPTNRSRPECSRPSSTARVVDRLIVRPRERRPTPRSRCRHASSWRRGGAGGSARGRGWARRRRRALQGGPGCRAAEEAGLYRPAVTEFSAPSPGDPEFAPAKSDPSVPSISEMQFRPPDSDDVHARLRSAPPGHWLFNSPCDLTAAWAQSWWVGLHRNTDGGGGRQAGVKTLAGRLAALLENRIRRAFGPLP